MKLSDAIAQAQRAPWTLDDDDGNPIVTVPQPSVDTWAAVAEAETMPDVIRVMAGAQADALLAAIGDAPAPVLKTIAEDMRTAFGLGN